MPMRVWRRVRLAPGVTLNISKKGASVTVGRRGAGPRVTTGASGSRVSVSVPGTGVGWYRRYPRQGRYPR